MRERPNPYAVIGILDGDGPSGRLWYLEDRIGGEYRGQMWLDRPEVVGAFDAVRVRVVLDEASRFEPGKVIVME